MPVPVMVSMVAALLVLGGCGRPIPSVRAGAEPEGQFVRVKSAQQAQAEQSHAENLCREQAKKDVAAVEPAAETHEAFVPTRPSRDPAAPPPRADEPPSLPSPRPAKARPPETPEVP